MLWEKRLFYWIYSLFVFLKSKSRRDSWISWKALMSFSSHQHDLNEHVGYTPSKTVKMKGLFHLNYASPIIMNLYFVEKHGCTKTSSKCLFSGSDKKTCAYLVTLLQYKVWQLQIRNSSWPLLEFLFFFSFFFLVQDIRGAVPWRRTYVVKFHKAGLQQPTVKTTDLQPNAADFSKH